MIVCGEVAMLILCANFDDYLWTFSWLSVGILWLFVQSLGIICGTFDDYFWGSRWNVDNFFPEFVGILMIISGEAGAMLIICGILKRVWGYILIKSYGL